MEWMAEGITHISIGTLIVLLAATGASEGFTAHLVYRLLAGVSSRSPPSQR